LVVFGLKLIVFVLWMLALPILFLWDFIVGFLNGTQEV